MKICLKSDSDDTLSVQHFLLLVSTYRFELLNSTASLDRRFLGFEFLCFIFCDKSVRFIREIIPLLKPNQFDCFNYFGIAIPKQIQYHK